MTRHIIEVTEDGAWSIECLDGNGCSGWIECDGDHAGYDPEDEASPAFDCYEDVEIHGVPHDWQWDYAWTIPYEGCVVQGANVDPPDELYEHETVQYRPGRWVVDADWDYTDCCYLTLSGLLTSPHRP